MSLDPIEEILKDFRSGRTSFAQTAGLLKSYERASRMEELDSLALVVPEGFNQWAVDYILKRGKELGYGEDSKDA